MKPIFYWSLEQRKKSTIGWAFGSSFLIFINLIFYPTFKNQASELQKSFENLPQSAVQLLGGSTDFFSPIGFLNSQIYFLMLPLILGVLSINLAHKIIANDETSGTIQLLLSRPVSRAQFLLAKASSAATVVLIVTAASLATTLLTSRFVELQVSIIHIVLTTTMCLLLVLSLGSVAFMISALGKPRFLSTPIAATIGLGSYVVSSLSATIDWLSLPAKILPFNYYHPSQILNGIMNWQDIIYFLGVIGISAVISYRVFTRRDIE